MFALAFSFPRFNRLFPWLELCSECLNVLNMWLPRTNNERAVQAAPR